MKSVLLIIVFCIISAVKSSAQYVSLEDIIAIHNSSYDKINGLLLPKGWMFQAKRLAHDSLGTCLPNEVVWAFEPNDYADRAHSYVVLAESDNCGKKVTYQTLDITNYNKIRASIIKYKMTLTRSDVGELDGKSYISSTFVGARYQLDLVVYTLKDASAGKGNSYNLFLVLR
jgi:hypothetical protein